MTQNRPSLQKRPKNQISDFYRFFAFLLVSLFATSAISAQSRHSQGTIDSDETVINVIASRSDKKTDPIKVENLFLYENGFEQKIKNFSFDPSPSRIVILVDNSQTLPTDLEKMKKAAMEFAYEIFDGDQLFVIAYDEKPEIVQEWTDDAKKMEASMAGFRKKGNPYLFDAMNAAIKEVLLPLMPGTRKTAIVVIGDGLDRGSKTQFDKLMNELTNDNITVYSLKLPDRTGGAYRRDQPKASEVLTQLTEGTGGTIFDFENAQDAAKSICDELRQHRYLLSYSSLNTSSYDARRLFLVADTGISVRTKQSQPPNVK
jgi:VWFA-related protein